MNELGRERERHAIFTGDFGGVEEKQLVNNACGERGAVEGAAGFEEEAEDFAATEFREDGRQVDTAASCFCMYNFDAGLLQFAHLGRIERRRCKDQQIVVRGLDDAKGWRESQFRIEDDAEETLAARILVEEHRIYTEAVRIVLEGKYKIVGRRVVRVE